MKPEEPKTASGQAECREVGRWLQVFLDDEMQDHPMVMRLAAHLDLCHRCTDEAHTLSELKNCLRKLQPPADPDALQRLNAFVHDLETLSGPSASA